MSAQDPKATMTAVEAYFLLANKLNRIAVPYRIEEEGATHNSKFDREVASRAEIRRDAEAVVTSLYLTGETWLLDVSPLVDVLAQLTTTGVYLGDCGLWDRRAVAIVRQIQARCKIELARAELDGDREDPLNRIKITATVAPTKTPNANPTSPTHSADFTTVNWYGEEYRFDDGHQSKAIELLWAEFEKGGHGLSEKTIGEKIGSAASDFRLTGTFRKHPALVTMIENLGRGIYRLKKPE